jgi:UDP-N-acetylmuramyl pentapeptide synthase
MKKLLRNIKRSLYFIVAGYFGFFASIYLKRWKPQIITVTGSSGKTTLLHLFEAQLKNKAIFSHKANSAFGIPFHILGLERESFKFYEWIVFLVVAPFMSIRPIPDKKIYVTEADAERPGEGKFLAKLLKPDILVWLSLEEAHGVNYDRLISKDHIHVESTHNSPEHRIHNLKQIIAEEFGWFLTYTKSYVVLNKDNEYIASEAGRTKAEVTWISARDIVSADARRDSVVFFTHHGEFHIPHLVPFNAGTSVLAVAWVMSKLGLSLDEQFRHFELPPGRSTVFKGKNNITIIDSSYNATMDGMRAMLELFGRYPAPGEKWLVLGDMIEQGKSEAHEHMALAHIVKSLNPDRVVLVGPRLAKYTYPILQDTLGAKKVVSFGMPGKALLYLNNHLRGGEMLLVKGARFLEGIVEKLLLDPDDAAKLCRREAVWAKRRKQWGI